MSKGNLIKETPYSEITATLEVLDSFGINREHLAKLRSNADAAKRVVSSIFRETTLPKLITGGFPIEVNYEYSVKSALESGVYDRAFKKVSAVITDENFPAREVGKAYVIIECVALNKIYSISDALIELDRKGYRPAYLQELIALGHKYRHSISLKNKLNRSKLIALGSICYDLPDHSNVYLVPFLKKEKGVSQPNIETTSLKNHCTGIELFAAVRK